MRCQLCGNVTNESPSFQTLFQPYVFCLSCRRRYHPVYATEVIPYSNGLIYYHSVFDFEEDDPRANRLLFRYAKRYFVVINETFINNELVLWIDKNAFQTLPKWISLIYDYDVVVWFSLFHFDFSIFEDL